MARIELRALPPDEAVRYFRSKGFAIGFAWQDVWQEEHARAFTVAKVARYDILRDIRDAVDQAIAEGKSLAQFRRELTPVLQEKGWWGRQRAVDPLTGEVKTVQLGSPRRLKTIFDVNMRVAHAAGAWERTQRLKKRRPFLRYVQIDRASKRQAHVPWHNTVLAVDHPWWRTHYPPNGWNCGCRAVSLSERDLARFGFEVSPRAPAVRTRAWRNKRSGRVIQVPEGIDPGWGYNVGQAHMRGLVPPPRGGDLPPPLIGPAAAGPLPAPREAPRDRLLPKGLSDEQYLERFLAEFDATPDRPPDRPKVFTDRIGEPVIIGRELFTTRGGKPKVQWRGRFRHLLLLADTIRNPDEIWWQWEEFPKGRMTLLRRYLARWTIEGRETPTFVLFDVGKDGWRGVTGFAPDRRSYLEGQRGGTLAYRRRD